MDAHFKINLLPSQVDTTLGHKSRLDEMSEEYLMYYLTEELLDMYPYRGDVNYINCVHEFRRIPQYDYIQKNGDPYYQVCSTLSMMSPFSCTPPQCGLKLYRQ